MPNAAEMQEELHDLRSQLDRLSSGALYVAVIISMTSDKLVVSTGSGPNMEVLRPDFDVGLGDTITLQPQTGQIVEICKVSVAGSVVNVSDVLDDGLVEIEGPEAKRVAILGPKADKVQKGCRVVLDSTGHVVLLNLGRPAAQFVRGETTVDWDEIGGLEEIKRDMIEAIEHPHKYPEIYKSYDQKPPKGVALQGPPGTGKTMLGKAVATSISHIYEGKQTKLSTSGFLYIKGPEILNKYVGEAESCIREIFERAREHKREHGFPAVIFLDEADAVLGKRGSGVSSDIERTIVPSFLSEMDGLDDSSAIVILATNRVNLLDPAVLRDGRIDRKLYVARPDQNASETIMRLNLKRVPLDSKIGELSKLAVEAMWSNDRYIGLFGTSKTKIRLYLRDMISGAMVKNVVDLAVASAIRRDIEAGLKKKEKKEKVSGVNEHDIMDAVKAIHKQVDKLDHADVLEEIKERQKQAEGLEQQTERPLKASAASAA